MMAFKTILITGATSGFGEATARLFHKNGYQVILTGRRQNRLEKLNQELKENIHTLCFDIRNYKETQKSIESLPDKFKDIDILVNNAGLALGLEPAHEAHLEKWEQMIDTNIKGLVQITRLILPQMVQKNSGYIFNIGSVAGTHPYPGGNVYGGTKAFVRQFSLNLKSDLHGKNIRVTNIEPGLAETEFSIVRFDGDKNKADQVYKNTQPLVGDDIAQVIWMLSQLPDHVNVSSLEILPTCQSYAGFQVHRRS